MPQDWEPNSLQDHLDQLHSRAGNDRHIQRMMEHFSREMPPPETGMLARGAISSSVLPTPPSSTSWPRSAQLPRAPLPILDSRPARMITGPDPGLVLSGQTLVGDFDDSLPRLNANPRPSSSVSLQHQRSPRVEAQGRLGRTSQVLNDRINI